MDAQRSALLRAVKDRKESLASLSRSLGKNAAYLQQYINRGSPQRLPIKEARYLARRLGISLSELLPDEAAAFASSLDKLQEAFEPQALSVTIAQSKERIAQAAGCDPSQVKITIDM